MPSPMRGRWHGGAVTDEVGHLRLRGAVHLISRLRRQLPLIGEALGVRCTQCLPQGEGGCGAKRSRRMRAGEQFRFAETAKRTGSAPRPSSVSASPSQLPPGEAIGPLRRGSPLRPCGPAPLDKGSLGFAQIQSLPLSRGGAERSEAERFRSLFFTPPAPAGRGGGPVRSGR